MADERPLLHGQSEHCFMRGCPEPVAAGDSCLLHATPEQLRDALRRFTEAARALRQACRDTGHPVVPAPVATAVKVVCDLGGR